MTPPTVAAPPPKRPFRILTIDGGSAALLSVNMIGQIEATVPGFLSKVDLFAGTSSGGINSLIFAAAENPATRLEIAENYWRYPQNYYKNSIFGLMKAAMGLGAINNPKYTQDFLAQPGVLGNLSLGDLKHKAMVVTFDVAPQAVQASTVSGAVSGPNWRVKILRNFGDNNTSLGTLAVDAALSTSASPIVTPIHQSKVDGGLAANNPTMCALAEIARHGKELDPQVSLDDVLILSVGGGRAHENIGVDNANWGYLRWLLNPTNPLLLLNAFLSGSADATTFQAREFLPAGRVWRLDPFFTHGGVIPFMQVVPSQLDKTSTEPSTLAAVNRTCEWIKRSNWMA